MPPPDPLIGSVIANVRLTARLGAGAMGVVYRGTHTVFNREVAVKLLGQAHATGKGRERFLREARAAAKVRSPHVVSVEDAGDSGGRVYLVMELVIGRSVGELLDSVAERDRANPPAGRPAGALAVEAVATIGAQVAKGLVDAHAVGIVHRDIKPDNIMVAGDGTAKIADLGLAKQLDDPDLQRLTGSGMVVGTPLYVSPDAIRSPESVNGQADVYSLGATLYHCLAGKPPFDGKTPYEVMKSHLEDRPQPLLELRPGCPRGLAQLVERCLAKDPKARPTPVELAELLARGPALAGTTHRGPLVAVGVAALAVVALGAGAWWLLARRSPPPPVVPGRVTVQVDHPAVDASLDDGAWTPLGDAGLSVAPGDHRLRLRARQGGARWEWSGPVAVAAGGEQKVEATLARVAIPPARPPFPGSGMLFIEGRAFGLDPVASFTSPGSYAVGRWDGSLWNAGTVTVDEAGKAQVGALANRAQPEGPAWWCSLGPDDRPLDRHHVVCWQVADQVVQRQRLAVPPSWRAQGGRPEQPAVEYNLPLLVSIVQGLEATGGRLPEVRLAKQLAKRYQAPVWADERGQPTAVNGPALNAWLVLVPK
jgi:hypothetical protein